jgi:predicted AlkP superfamily phosphohydrolase/phosphomutase/tetratricopeptide (TPR) repeat protein
LASKRLILVGWDSADWKLINPLLDAGEMPGMAWLVEGGVSGNLATMEPQLSPMLWTSIATGKRAWQHGIHGFTEVDPASGRVVPVAYASRRCKTVWEILGERGLRSHVVGWFATHGEPNPHGGLVSNMATSLRGVGPDDEPAKWPPLPPGTCWPPELADEIAPLRVSPYDLDPEKVLRLFVPRAHEIDQENDPRLWHLAGHLAEALSVHTHATYLMEKDPDWDFTAIYYRPLDEICHRFMAYHPPCMEGVPERDFEIYRDVVNSTYRLYDLFLRRLLHFAGPEGAVMVVSDHGFHSDHLRPKFTPNVPAGITIWHRPQGIIAARGPGIRADELVFGARLLDIAPTVLGYFGLPAGRDMDGRVLAEAFTEPTTPEPIATWENPGGIQRERLPADDPSNRAMLEHFVALGYLAEIPGADAAAAEGTRQENDWSLARAFMDAGRAADALPLLESCVAGQPARTDFAQMLAMCQLQLGLLDEAEESTRKALEAFGPRERAQHLLASIALQRDRPAEAVALLESVGGLDMSNPNGLLLLARSYVELRRWDEAAEAAKRSIALDADNPQPYLALTRQLLHRKLYAEAAEAALSAISLDFARPNAHFLLGAALAGDDQLNEACQALHTCLKLEPAFLRAYRLLARIHRKLGDEVKALAYDQQYRAVIALGKVKFVPLPKPRAAVPAPAIPPAETPTNPGAELEFIIVSGLPRSGTSLMMQILRAGGIPVMTDELRAADEDNPEGYWEWEEIKKLPNNPGILLQARGKALKIISALLPALPLSHRYKIIFMTRPIAQVVESQWAMLARQGKAPGLDKQRMAVALDQHSRHIRQTLAASSRVELLEVSYADLVANPQPLIDELAKFLGDGFTPGPAVLSSIRPRLHRQRDL